MTKNVTTVVCKRGKLRINGRFNCSNQIITDLMTFARVASLTLNETQLPRYWKNPWKR